MDCSPRFLGEAREGDLLVVGGSGAYCSGMAAKNYNSFPEAAEVLKAPDGHAASDQENVRHWSRLRQTK